MRAARWIAPALALPMMIGPALAHETDAAGYDPWRAWSFESLVVVPLAIVGFAWLVGIIRLGRRSRARVRAWRNAAFACGWLSLAGALCSPLHAAGSWSFLAHMSEHEILMLIAAPLLALSRPSGVLLWGLPPRERRWIGQLSRRPSVRRTWRAATDAVPATLVHGGLLWIWHAPLLFDAAVRNSFLHVLQHACFFVSAVFFWWAMFNGRARDRGFGLAALALFFTAVHSSLLGALLVFSRRIWYAYGEVAGGLAPREDQQLAGLVMWVPAGVIYTIAGLVLFALWLQGSAGRSRENGCVGLLAG